MADRDKKKTNRGLGKTPVDHNYGTRGKSDLNNHPAVIQQQPGSARKLMTRTFVHHHSTHLHTSGTFDPCSECIVPDENLVQCDFCENSFCFACSNVTDKPSFHQIVRNTEENGLNWFCKHCRFSFPGVKKIDCRVTKVENKQEETVQHLEKLESNGDIDQKVNEAMHEYREIENRKFNIMCFGLAESHIEEGSEQQPRDIDAQKLHQIFTEVLELKSEDFKMFEEHKPIRIGAYRKEDTNKCRPIKITVSTVKEKQNILQLARKKIKKFKTSLV